jgi:hypothetical protein
MTYKEWLTGTIPVVPFLDEIKLAPIKVDLSEKNHALLEVILIPKSNKLRAEIFTLDVNKVGKGKDAHWVVNSWAPRSHPTIPNNPAASAGGPDAVRGGSAYPERMRRLLASSRFRRRAGWLGVCLAFAGAVSFVGLHFSNTGHADRDNFERGKPQLVPKRRRAMPFTPAEQRPGSAPSRSGSSERGLPQERRRLVRPHDERAAAGPLACGVGDRHDPVVPFSATAVDTVRWRLDYSDVNEVGLKVAFYTKPESGVDRQVFDIRLQDRGKPGSRRWLVSYWAPSGGLQLSQADPRVPRRPRMDRPSRRSERSGCSCPSA